MAPSASVSDFNQAALIFAALSDPTRLKVVERLAHDGPLSISELAQNTTISRQAMTKHLAALENAALATSRRLGRERIFEFRPDQLSVIHQYLNQISQQWDEALDRLRVHVEK